MSLENTWKRVKGMAQNKSHKSTEEVMLRSLGVDKDVLDKIEKESLNAVKENLKIKIKYINHSNNEEPSYKHLDDSGMDIRANLNKSITLKPGERMAIPTGLHYELPESMEIQVRPRSGLALKHGITVLNTPGTVDRGYTGEIKVILINLGNNNFDVRNGDRIAQVVVSPVISGRWAKLIKLSTLNTSDRGDGGFGSTGIK
mgnify:CR=1 FL=1